MPVEIGQTYERLRVAEKTSERRHGQIVWLCECTCGKQVRVVTHSLVSGATRSCGCLSVDELAGRRHDLTDRRFGKLVARQLQPDGRWLCECDCGNRIAVSARDLKQAVARGRERSCGCTRAERTREMVEQRKLGVAALEYMRVDGKSICAIRSSSPSCNSKTGVRGVSPLKNGKYRATITLKRRSIHIGTYSTVAEAAAARAEAEVRLYAPIIRAWTAERRNDEYTKSIGEQRNEHDTAAHPPHDHPE